jgi:hypothetical protein
MFKFSVKISWQTPQLIPTVSASSWIVRGQYLWMSSLISVILLVLGCPVLVANLASFTQKLMQTRCSIFPSITDRTKKKVEKALM